MFPQLTDAPQRCSLGSVETSSHSLQTEKVVGVTCLNSVSTVAQTVRVCVVLIGIVPFIETTATPVHQAMMRVVHRLLCTLCIPKTSRCVRETVLFAGGVSDSAQWIAV